LTEVAEEKPGIAVGDRKPVGSVGVLIHQHAVPEVTGAA
jgi:hypothetical protein